MSILDTLRHTFKHPSARDERRSETMHHDSPYVFLDLLNLIEGEGTSQSEAQEVLENYLPLVERCCAAIWNTRPQSRYASSLSSISPKVHETLESYGYIVEVAEPDRTDTMLIERASKRDDYLLAREVKRRVQAGARELLIVSGDRDFERLATELAVFAPKCHYVQRRKMAPQNTTKLTRYRSLDTFSAPLEPHLEAMLQERSSHDHSQGDGDQRSAKESDARFIIHHAGQRVREIPLSQGFMIGRTSGRSGAVELCLSEYDRAKDYSRQLAQINKLGDSWVLWRCPQAPEKTARQPIVYQSADSEPEPLNGGESVILSPGDRLRFTRCEVDVVFE